VAQLSLNPGHSLPVTGLCNGEWEDKKKAGLGGTRAGIEVAGRGIDPRTFRFSVERSTN
jgi:hypothetical protein